MGDLFGQERPVPTATDDMHRVFTVRIRHAINQRLSGHLEFDEFCKAKAQIYRECGVDGYTLADAHCDIADHQLRIERAQQRRNRRLAQLQRQRGKSA